MLPTIEELIILFKRVNDDIRKDKTYPVEVVVPLTDQDFYANQIYSLYEEDLTYKTATLLAMQMARRIASSIKYCTCPLHKNKLYIR